MSQIEKIKQAIMTDPQNASYTEQGIEPLFAAPKTARINIIGQAPGLKTQEAGLYWKDKSGDRLREWLGVDEDTFYNSGYFAVMPMDFYFPGHGKSGDLPPQMCIRDRCYTDLDCSLCRNSSSKLDLPRGGDSWYCLWSLDFWFYLNPHPVSSHLSRFEKESIATSFNGSRRNLLCSIFSTVGSTGSDRRPRSS